MADIAGTVSYPNLPPLVQFSYTCSRGVGPGTIILRTQVGDAVPPATGTMIFGDSDNRPVALQRVRLSRFTVEKEGGSGTMWSFEFQDARWAWKYSAISGFYNQLDPHGKLIPKTVRSPTELAKLCMAKLGITRYVLDLPPGLSSDQVGNIPEFLPAGVQLPVVGVNPVFNWYAEGADVALAELCDRTGRIPVYDPVTDTALVVRPGMGGRLPDGSIQAESPAITVPVIPDQISVVGDPTVYQVMLELYAVGLEWDGSLRPINNLSYAPLLSVLASQGPKSLHTVQFAISDAVPGRIYRAVIVLANGLEIGVNATGVTTALIAADMMALFQAQPLGQIAFQTASTLTESVVIATLQVPGVFDAAGNASVQVSIIQAGVPHGVGNEVTVPGLGAAGGAVDQVTTWSRSQPPDWQGIRATPRLTREQARSLADQGVYKMYRLTGRDIDGKPGIFVPGYGRVTRDQIWLTDVQVAQVVPEKGDRAFRDLDRNPLIRSVYDGYSRSRPAAVYGAVSRSLFNNPWYIGPGLIPNDNPQIANVGLDAALAAEILGALGQNTEAGTQVPIDFRVDPWYQSICFSQQVYALSQGRMTLEPKLYLYCAVQVRDPNTRQFVPYTYTLKVTGGNTTAQILKRPDVQLNIDSSYRWLPAARLPAPGQVEQPGHWKYTGSTILENDPIIRARYYAESALAVLQTVPGETIKYNGIVPISMDGRIAQVSWNIQGGSGCGTVASINGEHDVWIPQYPVRRRAEALPPVERGVDPKNRVRIEQTLTGNLFQ